MPLALWYLLEPIGRQRAEEKGQVQTKPRQRSPAPGRVFRSRTSASLTQAQIRSRKQSQQRGGAQWPAVQKAGGDVIVTDASGYLKSDRSEQTFQRTSTGPVGLHRRSNRSLSLVQPLRAKSLRLLRSTKDVLSQTPPSSSVLPSSLRYSIPSSTPPSSTAPQRRNRQKQQDAARTALIKKLSSRHQTSFPFRNTRESQLI